MITITKNTINNIPILTVVKEQIQEEALPTVIYYHGFYGQKQDSLTIAYEIAKHDIRVILPDAHMHGERNNGHSKADIDLSFWDIVIQNVTDIHVLYEYLCTEKLFNQTDNRIGIGGTSMGGITTAASLTQYNWIDCAAIVMGSPHLADFATYLIHVYNQQNKQPIDEKTIQMTMEKIAPFDLGLMPEKANNKPLMFWHGTDDIVVPTNLSEKYYETNKQTKTTGELKYVKEKGRSHHVSRLAVAETSAWFTSHLK